MEKHTSSPKMENMKTIQKYEQKLNTYIPIL